jgi:hypothetical protein
LLTLLWCATVTLRPLRLSLGSAFTSVAILVAGGPSQAAPMQADDRDPPELRLAWDVPAACPPASEVKARFDHLLGGRGRIPSSKRVQAIATAQRTPSGSWILRLDTTVDDAIGHRDLEGDSCWAVAAAAALVLALTIDPNAAVRASLTPPPDGSPPQSPPAPPQTSAAVLARPLEAMPLRPFVRAFGGVVVALLPQPGPVAGLAAGIQRGWIDADLSSLGSLETRAYAPNRPGAGGYFRLLAFGTRACARATAVASPVVLRLCAGAEIERITARGFGVELPGSGGATLVAGIAAAVAGLRLASWVEMALELIGTARPYHPTFVLTGVGDVFTVPAASAVGALALSFRL